MNRSLSLFLDLTRLAAAMAVVASHATWHARALGPAGVGVFFVLSGYVISHVTSDHEQDWRGYAIARLARVYSVLVPIVVLVLLLDTASRGITPEAVESQVRNHVPWLAVPATLAFVNEFWSAHLEVGTDGPLWSLSFEIAYYAAFGVARFGSGWPRVAVPVAILLAAGPHAIALAPLWMCGVLLHRALHREGRARAGAALLLGAMALVAIVIGASRDEMPRLAWATDPDLIIRYCAGLGFAVMLTGVSLRPQAVATLGRWESSIRWAAGATFTLYLLHVPAMILILALFGSDRFGVPAQLASLVGGIVFCFAVAEFTERRKEPWRRLFTRVLSSPARALAPAK